MPSVSMEAQERWRSLMSPSHARSKCPAVVRQRRWSRRWGRQRASWSPTERLLLEPLSSRPS
ncbi:hypothetical protein MHYP_G00299450 [Metynnis hypsauchen]